ncbi:MAG: hypothetical protein HFJ65_08355 [Eggerthellaceae bacterium]|nr:hypothetical protein [Eggerthellaceae bacterium]
MQCTYEGIKFTCDTEIEETEALNYVVYYVSKFPNLESLDVKIDGDYADVTYNLTPSQPFERIRRITGYLVGTLDRFNDAKRAEEADRVKHEAVRS